MSSDMWDQIFTKLPKAIDAVEEMLLPSILQQTYLYKELEERYRKGDALHQGEWKDWNPDTFIENIREEVYDMIIYCAMNLVRAEMTKKYGSPGMSYNQAKLLSCNESTTENESAA